MSDHPKYYNPYPRLEKEDLTNIFQNKFNEYYDKVRNITIVAITGGRSDLVVDPPNEIIDGIIPPKHGFSVMTSFVPDVNKFVDHHGIMHDKIWVKVFANILMKVYNLDKKKKIGDRYKIINVLANYLLPKPSEYEKLYKSMIAGYNGDVNEKLSYMFYMARVSVNFTPPCVAAALFILFLSLYGVIDGTISKVKSIKYFQFLDPFCHFKCLKKIHVFKYFLIASCTIQTIKFIIYNDFISPLPNFISLLIFYTGGLSMLFIIYWVIFTFMTLGGIIYKNLILKIESKLNEMHSIIITVLMICISTEIYILFFYPQSIILLQTDEILKFSIIFIHKTIIMSEIICLIGCNFNPENTFDSVYVLFGTLRFLLYTEQLSLWNEENMFLQAPPNTYKWKDMGYYIYGMLMEIPLGLLYYFLFNISFYKRKGEVNYNNTRNGYSIIKEDKSEIARRRESSLVNDFKDSLNILKKNRSSSYYDVEGRINPDEKALFLSKSFSNNPKEMNNEIIQIDMINNNEDNISEFHEKYFLEFTQAILLIIYVEIAKLNYLIFPTVILWVTVLMIYSIIYHSTDKFRMIFKL